MRRALLCCIGLVCIAGCGDPAARAYYQTRYVPTSSETVFSATERAKWRGDLSVYELPAAPPDLDGEALARNECAKPGPKFKAAPVVGLHGETPASGQADLQVPSGMDKRPVPVGALGPLPGYAIAAQRGPDVAGLPQHNLMTTVGDWDTRQPTPGINVRAPQPMGLMRPADKADYCLPPETPAAPAATTR
jgi:hypothetical protein